MRRVEYDQPCLGNEETRQCGGVEGPTTTHFPQGPGVHGATEGLRYLGERLVAGCVDDYVVAGREDGEAEIEDRLLGPGVHDDRLGIQTLVQPRQPGAEFGRPAGLGVAEPVVQVARFRPRLQGEEFACRHGLAVGAGEQKAGAELVLGEIALEGEGLEERHGLMIAQGREMAQASTFHLIRVMGRAW